MHVVRGPTRVLLSLPHRERAPARQRSGAVRRGPPPSTLADSGDSDHVRPPGAHTPAAVLSVRTPDLGTRARGRTRAPGADMTSGVGWV